MNKTPEVLIDVRYAIHHNYQARLKMLVTYKHSSLFQMNDEEEKFPNIDTRGLHYKTLPVVIHTTGR